MKNTKTRDFIATHVFHSPNARKAFFDNVKDRKKKLRLVGNETTEVKEKFLLTLNQRKILDSVDLEKDQSTDYALVLQIFLGKGDFFFCHWKALDEQSILDRLSVAGMEQFIVNMATQIDFPKMNLDFLQP